MKKRTKIFVLVAMVLLLGVTGFLNVMLNNSVSEDVTPTVTTNASYFELYRSDRETTRDQELLYYQAILESKTLTDEEKLSVQTAIDDLTLKMEKELIAENTIKGYGFSDCIITSVNDNVNVIVQAESLTSSEVAQIVSVIQDTLHTKLKNIKIIPVK